MSDTEAQSTSTGPALDEPLPEGCAPQSQNYSLPVTALTLDRCVLYHGASSLLNALLSCADQPAQRALRGMLAWTSADRLNSNFLGAD